MSSADRVIVALSGGVDSAVAALLLRDEGYLVECLHMTNWEDDGYCDSAAEFQDARRVCEQLGLPLHRVNFAAEYKQAVFADFLRELAAGRTPNPDVLCNREIKFGHMQRYAARLGGRWLATGHYARIRHTASGPLLLKGRDPGKDQSYFLNAVPRAELANVLFPLGDRSKSAVRELARQAGLRVADKRDSTGICFIGERPFGAFLAEYLPASPGPIVTPDGTCLGTHRGLAWYTLGQRQGLEIGGLSGFPDAPWYVAAKRPEENALLVVQGSAHPALFARGLTAGTPHWLIPDPPAPGSTWRTAAKTRYRQPDQACQARITAAGCLALEFDQPQRAVTPGQYVVLYKGEQCLGGAVIEQVMDAAGRSSTGVARKPAAAHSANRRQG